MRKRVRYPVKKSASFDLTEITNLSIPTLSFKSHSRNCEKKDFEITNFFNLFL